VTGAGFVPNFGSVAARARYVVYLSPVRAASAGVV